MTLKAGQMLIKNIFIVFILSTPLYILTGSAEALSFAELKAEVDNTYKTRTLQDWKDQSNLRGITQRSQKDFDWFKEMYPEKVGRLMEMLAESKDEEEQDFLTQKIARLKNKFATVCMEEKMRLDGDVVRTNLHDQANYYIDYDNGTDSPGGTVHDGLAEPADPGGAVYTMVDGTTTATDGTHAVLAINDFDNDTDDNYNGDYLYNITRSTGVIITDYDADDTDDGSVLVHPNIAGQVAGDTFYILRAVKNIHFMTTTQARTAGDILYIRANITWDQGTEAVDIIMDEDGTGDNYISIIGCDSVTNDPWVDADNTLPIIDFEDAAYQIKMTGDRYWYLERLDIRQSNDAEGAIGNNSSHNMYLKSCVIRDAFSSGSEGIRILSTADVTIDSCSFTDNIGRHIDTNRSSLYIKSCTFNGGAATTDYGIYNSGSRVYIEDTTFGVTTAHDASDVRTEFGGITYARNCTWNTGPDTASGGIIYSEDDDATFESHITTTLAGTITRDIGTVRGGGANSSAKMVSVSGCGANNPLVLGHPITGFAQVWVAKDVQIDIDVYVAVGSAWDAALTAAECYAEFSYLSNAVTAVRTVITSNDTITNDTNFTTALDSGNFTPLQTGFVYIWVYLEEYEDATEHIFVDIKPVVN